MSQRPFTAAATDQVSGRLVVLAAVVITLLASCTVTPPARSSSPPPTPTPFAPSPAPTPSPSFATVAVPSASPTPSPTPAIVTSGEPVCAASQLQLAYTRAFGGGAAGSFAVAIGIWNHSTQACKLRGWATVQFLNPAGGLVPTHWVETTSDFSGSAQPRTVSVLPCAGAPSCAPDSIPGAYFTIAGDDVIEPCVTAAAVRVALPATSTSAVANLRVVGFQDGQIFCSDGSVRLLPIISPFAALGPPFA